MKIQPRTIVSSGLLLLLTLSNSGCNFNNAGFNSALTQAQALEITGAVFAAMANAPIAKGGSPQVALQSIAPHIRTASLGEILAAPAIAASLVRPLQTAPTTIPSYTYACPDGGTIGVTGSYTGNFSTTPPSENIVETTVETVTNCSENGTVFNGNPTINATSTIVLNGTVYDDSTTITGGYTVGANVCVMNLSVTATVDSSTNAVNGTISGTACGVTLSGTIVNSQLGSL